MKDQENRRWQSFTPEILLVVYLLLFLVVKQPYLNHDRVIISDGKAYYGYLTAIFIYHDFSYDFIEEYERKYYSEDPGTWKEFRTPAGSGVVNKGFPGLAVLFLPFFLIAHLLSLLLGFPVDGYSIMYQYVMGLSAIFYFWLGLKVLQKLLRTWEFQENLIAAVLALIALGTNIIYYTLKEGTMGHVYSFAMIGLFMYLVRLAALHFAPKFLFLAALTFSLIITIRPTNGLVILLVPVVCGSAEGFTRLIRNIFSSWKTAAISLAAVMAFPWMTMLLWYLQSGRWIAYSYGEEGFDFLNPHFFQILLSFEKGWFLYTPVAFLSMAGLIWLFQNRRVMFYWTAAFLVVFVYVASSWWAWAYTSNFGQRIFVDLYAVVGLLLAFAWLLVRRSKWLKHLTRILLVFLVALNGLQFYQHYTFIFPPGKITAQKYADAFFRLVPAARTDFPDSLVVKKEVFYNDFEKDYGWINRGSVTDTLSYEGCCASMAGLVNPYSIGFLTDINPLLHSSHPWVKVSGQIYSNQRRSNARLVIQLENEDGYFFYSPFYLKTWNRKNKWTYMEFATPLPPLQSAGDKLRVFFYHMNDEELFLVDNLTVEVISMKRSFELF
ncbi:MAG: hypothetical protein ACLFPE_14110 [Bacteroidales bacterium]